jgi:hypothetical protein
MRRITATVIFTSDVTTPYVKGYMKGLNATNGVVHAPAQDRSTNKEEQTVEESLYTCTEDGCTDAFDTEHGRSVHEGVAHNND